jgi:DNA polymerase V
MIFIESNRFREHDEYYSKSIVIKLPFPTNSALELTEYAKKGFRAIFKEHIGYKRAGVVAMDFVPENEYQQSLFNNSNPKHKLLMQKVDTLNDKFGHMVRLASQEQNRNKMKQERLSQRYTTNLSECIIINV